MKHFTILAALLLMTGTVQARDSLDVYLYDMTPAAPSQPVSTQWMLVDDTDPITDEVEFYITRFAEEGSKYQPDPFLPSALVVAYKQGKLECRIEHSLITGIAKGKSTKVTHRFDKNPPVTKVWKTIIANYLVPGDNLAFANKMMSHHRLVIRVNVKDWQDTLIYNLTGLRSMLKPMLDKTTSSP